MTGRIPADHVRLKRVYAPASAAAGARVLVDKPWHRPWPALQQRGLALRRHVHQQLRDNLPAF